MDQWLSQPGSSDASGLVAGPAGIAYLGIALFLLLGIYAALLLNAGRLPRWLPLPSPAGLRPRLTMALVLVATLPTISLALVLSERAGSQRVERAAAVLQTQAVRAAGNIAHLRLETRSRSADLAPSSIGSLQASLAAELASGMVITDGAGRIVLAGPAAARAPEKLREAGLAADRAAGRPIIFSLGDDGGREFIGVAAGAGDGWRVLRYTAISELRAASLQEYGVALGWLLAALIVSVCLAVALAGSISGPLSALDKAVRQFDPELDHELPKPPANAPREVVVVIEHLATMAQRLRQSYGQLRQSLRQGERLRSELISVIESREQEIEGRTEQLKQLNASLDRLSRIDELTGVANRRGFTEFLDRAWRIAQREQQPLSILMIDIDHFKAYNDTYGHQQGDTCIKAVAETVGHVVSRAGDAVARYGGEEFVAVLGNTPLEGALQVAEQVRSAVQRLAIPHRSAPEHGVVTVSVGVTSTLPARGAQPDSSILAADRALYAAKEQGRNQVGYSTAARTGLYQSLCLPNDPVTKPS